MKKKKKTRPLILIEPRVRWKRKWLLIKCCTVAASKMKKKTGQRLTAQNPLHSSSVLRTWCCFGLTGVALIIIIMVMAKKKSNLRFNFFSEIIYAKNFIPSGKADGWLAGWRATKQRLISCCGVIFVKFNSMEFREFSLLLYQNLLLHLDRSDSFPSGLCSSLICLPFFYCMFLFFFRLNISEREDGQSWKFIYFLEFFYLKIFTT